MRNLALTLSLLCLSGTAAHAQTSIFASATLTDYGFPPPNSTVVYSKGNGGGATAGAFYNFHKNSRLTLGIDGRGSYSPGTQTEFGFVHTFNLGLVLSVQAQTAGSGVSMGPEILLPQAVTPAEPRSS
jgi:hypothetical protein